MWDIPSGVSLGGVLASLDVTKRFGHFCEIGKYDLMNNTKIGIRCFTSNISYHVIDLSEMIYDHDKSKILFKLVQDGLDEKEIIPLKNTTFTKDKIEVAIRHMGSGAHSGKLLIDMKAASSLSVSPRFITSGTHIITGGLGGFGLELAFWLVECGAQEIVLTSRSGVKTGHQAKRLSELQRKNKVVLSRLNVIDIDQCSQLIDSFRDNLRGVWHTAMVLEDVIFESMSVEKWNTCVDVKVQAFENLSICTKDIVLDIFCGFSSIIALYGNIGQSNYSYANNGLENLILERPENKTRRNIVIQWGVIGNVGFVSRGMKSKTSLNVYEEQTIDECLENMHIFIMSCTHSVISAYKKKCVTQKMSSINMSLKDWFLKTMGLEIEKVHDRSICFRDLGLDSLQTVETKNKLSNFGIDKTLNEIGSMTLNDIWDI